MLTCKETSYLASKKLDGKLNWHEQMSLWLHIVICSLCRRYVRDIDTLHLIMLKAGKKSLVLFSESERLSEQSRERIKNVLNKALVNSK